LGCTNTVGVAASDLSAFARDFTYSCHSRRMVAYQITNEQYGHPFSPNHFDSFYHRS
jgi:hypothetical protein